MKVRYLKNKAIDITKWNNCIKDSFNGNVYGFSWYLDIVAEEWDALVAENYKAVMPLPPGSKFKIDYLLQPLFAQQLGVYSTVLLTPDLVNNFLECIPEQYKLISLNLNLYNKVSTEKFKLYSGVTYQMDLIVPYHRIYKGYSNNTKRNIKKAQKKKITVVGNMTPNILIDLMQKNIGKKLKQIGEEEYNKIRKIISFAMRHRMGGVYGAFTAENELCAAVFFIESHNKSIYLFADSSSEGKENGSSFLLIDEYIRKNSESNLTLDFEGSSEEGLARFYSSFGATPCNYLKIKRNKLPWFLKPFARI